MNASLGRPAPGHEPRVGRTSIGMTPTRPTRPVYGTTLTCQCGWIAGRVSNDAPSRGGRVAANAAYRAHLLDEPREVFGRDLRRGDFIVGEGWVAGVEQPVPPAVVVTFRLRQSAPRYAGVNAVFTVVRHES